MSKKIILIHGFKRNSTDMHTLGEHLNRLGYCSMSVDLPLTFNKLECSIPIMEKFLEQLTAELSEGEKIHLVGHSTGGLVIRNVLSIGRFNNWIGRCVLISTPNKGSELADLAVKWCLPLTMVYKTLQSLQTKNYQHSTLAPPCNVEIGAIAGNKNNLLLEKLLNGTNDGLVTVKSVQINGLNDFVLVPYRHREIHYQAATAKLIDNFLRTGKFKQQHCNLGKSRIWQR